MKLNAGMNMNTRWSMLSTADVTKWVHEQIVYEDWDAYAHIHYTNNGTAMGSYLTIAWRDSAKVEY